MYTVPSSWIYPLSRPAENSINMVTIHLVGQNHILSGEKQFLKETIFCVFFFHQNWKLKEPGKEQQNM